MLTLSFRYSKLFNWLSVDQFTKYTTYLHAYIRGNIETGIGTRCPLSHGVGISCEMKRGMKMKLNDDIQYINVTIARLGGSEAKCNEMKCRRDGIEEIGHVRYHNDG